MRYACLIYVDGSSLDSLTGAAGADLRGRCRRWEEEMDRSGHLVGTELLQPVDSATTVRVRGGRPLATDGPARTLAEPLDRVLVIEARDLNDAIRLLARHPLGAFGSIEIRPVRRGARNAEAAGG